jgi:ABC-type nitrate/sulfonate/bicarbonate transport system permease component
MPVKWRDAALGFVATLIIWQLLSLLINRSVFPPPTQVLIVFARQISGELGRHFLVSAGRVVAAIILAVLAAVPAGLGLGQIRALDRFFSPLIYIVHPIPKIVFLPVILVLFGSGDFSKVFLIALILFFQILVVVRDEAADLRPELILSVRSVGAGRRALFRYVYFPASIPAVLTALRISVGTAVAVLFIAETYATTSGLGYYIIVESWGALRYPQMYAGVLAMSLLGLALYFAVDGLDRRLCSWREAG